MRFTSRPARSTIVSLLLTLVLAAALGGCGDDGDAASVEGQWCGRDVSAPAQCTGDGVGFLDVTQSGSALAGKWCEAFEKDCYTIEGGEVADRDVAFSYKFGTKPERVDAKLTLDGEGGELKGKLFSTKCNCNIPFTLHKL